MAARDEAKLVFPALAGLYESCKPYSYAIMRFATYCRFRKLWLI